MLQNIHTVWVGSDRVLLVCKMLGWVDLIIDWVGLGKTFGPESISAERRGTKSAENDTPKGSKGCDTGVFRGGGNPAMSASGLSIGFALRLASIEFCIS